jgi:hypothetical protein
MADEKLKELQAHVGACTVCALANKRVNDFCEEGKLLFVEYAKDHPPSRAAMVEIPKEQYDRLVAETKRRMRQGQRN